MIDPARAALTSTLAPLAEAARRAMASCPRVVVLVEGLSDRFAIEELAVRRGRDLAADGVLVAPMEGATNLGRFLAVFGTRGLDLRVYVLCDAREAAGMRRHLRGAGLPESVLYACT
ncbi:MAG: TOPRIM nucleotidyl transferase/hydrolase domain-containing protein, partial [Thermocrispum sp.]